MLIIEYQRIIHSECYYYSNPGLDCLLKYVVSVPFICHDVENEEGRNMDKVALVYTMLPCCSKHFKIDVDDADDDFIS